MARSFVDLLIDRNELLAGLGVHLLASCRAQLSLCATLLDLAESPACKRRGAALERIVHGRNAVAELLVRLDPADSDLDELASRLHDVDLRLAGAVEAAAGASMPAACAGPASGSDPSAGGDADIAAALAADSGAFSSADLDDAVVVAFARPLQGASCSPSPRRHGGRRRARTRRC